jgi:hypothetical protein
MSAIPRALHEIEVALEAAQSCIMGETPEGMSDEQARERTLEMIREALLVHLPVAKAGLPEQRPEYQGAKPLTNHAFAAYAARLAHKSAAWAADTLQTMPEYILDPIRADVAARYLREMRGLLDHMEQQVKRP